MRTMRMMCKMPLISSYFWCHICACKFMHAVFSVRELAPASPKKFFFVPIVIKGFRKVKPIRIRPLRISTVHVLVLGGLERTCLSLGEKCYSSNKYGRSCTPRFNFSDFHFPLVK